MPFFSSSPEASDWSLKATNWESCRTNVVPYETGAPGFHMRGLSVHRNTSVLHIKRPHSDQFCNMSDSTLPFEHNVEYSSHKTPSPVPSLSLSTVAREKDIAWHDENIMSSCIWFKPNVFHCRCKMKHGQARAQCETCTHWSRIQTPTCIT